MNIFSTCLLLSTLNVIAHVNTHKEKGGWGDSIRGHYKGHHRELYNDYLCFATWSTWGTCSAAYIDASGNDCGPQYQSRTRTLSPSPTGLDNFRCFHGLRDRNAFLETQPCTPVAPAISLPPCTSGVSCDYMSAKPLASSCTAGISSNTTMFKIAPAETSPNYLKLDNDTSTGDGFAFYYYPTLITPIATSPHDFCVEFNYQIGKSMELLIVMFSKTIATATDKNTVIRNMSLNKSKYVIRDVTYTSAVKTAIGKQVNRRKDPFYVGFIVMPGAGAAVADFKMNKLAVKEGSCQ